VYTTDLSLLRLSRRQFFAQPKSTIKSITKRALTDTRDIVLDQEEKDT